SDKPPGWTYRPVDHARHIAHLIDTLALRDLTLVVQDWGGPLGLWYAVHHPERIRRLVIMNTWMWPVAQDWHFVGFSTLMGGPLGRLACTYLNAFARVVMPLGFGDRARLTPDAHRHYLRPLDRPEVRKGTWVFPKEIVGSTVWLARLWARRHAITDRPALLVWGLKDLAFREHELRRWQALLPHAETQRLPTVGHYVQEEMGPALVPIVHDFLRRTES
ncbi:MAG: alpha/beta fold hydrolase, partial [Bacteroidetes bacterium]|nr:alpha/beta fold hydrolase [Bacteroidota bacterium]